MFIENKHNIILPKYLVFVKKKGLFAEVSGNAGGNG